MGWLFMTRTGMGEHTTPKTYLDAQFTYEREAKGDNNAEAEFIGLRVLDSACPGNRTWYGAIERYHEAGGHLCVFAGICLVKWNPRAKDDLVFGYKDMDETAGPSEAGCPQRILDLLTSTNEPYALDWRRRCHLTARLRARKLPDGALIRLPEAMTFTDGSKHSEFRVRREGRRFVLTDPDGGGLYRVSGLMERAFEIACEPVQARTVFPSASA
ncbi:MAG: hypothetical protein V2I39_01830 [Erythrobacter sp.]|jgi:hypothetical protein|nr:hypothetical protein [Erythrobacter sp.]